MRANYHVVISLVLNYPAFFRVKREFCVSIARVELADIALWIKVVVKVDVQELQAEINSGGVLNELALAFAVSLAGKYGTNPLSRARVFLDDLCFRLPKPGQRILDPTVFNRYEQIRRGVVRSGPPATPVAVVKVPLSGN